MREACSICHYRENDLLFQSLLPRDEGTGTIRPHTLQPRTFRPRTIRPHTLFPDVFMSPYVSSLNKSQPTELYQPWIGWAFSLT
jgi:hypothetical protein